jgi:hypothetical protein
MRYAALWSNRGAIAFFTDFPPKTFRLDRTV